MGIFDSLKSSLGMSNRKLSNSKGNVLGGNTNGDNGNAPGKFYSLDCARDEKKSF
jgi:hypothetical protein